MSSLLKDGGSYYVICPDKRYCFDHFIPETTIGDVQSAHRKKRTRHTAFAWVAHRTLTTHNDAIRHWNGDHGARVYRAKHPKALIRSIGQYARAQFTGEYLDCHAWQFTPSTFQSILEKLVLSGLIDLEPVEVFDTLKDRYEFCAVLRKRA